MNNTVVKGNWEELKGKLKKKFAVLTNNDMLFEEGKKRRDVGEAPDKIGQDQG